MSAASIAASRVASAGKYFWRVLSALSLCAAIVSCACSAYYAFVNHSQFGWLGTEFHRTGGAGRRHDVVGRFYTGGARWPTDVHSGDAILFDAPWDDIRTPRTGDIVRYTNLSRRDGSAPIVQAVEQPPLKTQDLALYALNQADGFVMLVVGLFILWRKRDVAATVALGMSFVSCASAVPMGWPISAEAFPFWAVVIFGCHTAVGPLLLRFSMFYSRGEKIPYSAPLSPNANRLFSGVVLLQMVSWGLEIYSTLENVGVPGLEYVRPFSYLVQVGTLLLATGYLLAGWLRGDPVARQRYVLMLIALPMTFCPKIITLIQSLTGGILLDTNSPLTIGTHVAMLFGPVLFAYAIVRDKILDLGFAINRVLVYGAVSLFVLVSFGLLEWLAGYVIHQLGGPRLEGGSRAALDAGIAVIIFLFLHRVRHFVDKRIQALLFRAWQRNEAALRRFVQDADAVSRVATLSRDFVTELRRFTGGAQCALYMAGASQFPLSEGSLPESPAFVDTDDPLLVRLRADGLPVDVRDTTSGLPALLAVPVMHRRTLMGVVLLGQKPSREAYRPDEIASMAWAAREIGLDLYALRAAQLERENSRLQISYEAVKGLIPGPHQQNA